MKQKRCNGCDMVKGFKSFNGKSSICKMCIQENDERLHLEGEVVNQICSKCGYSKNKFVDFGKQASGISKRICKPCISTHVRNHKGITYKPRCNNSFIFNDKRVCFKCKNEKDSIFFSDRKIDCLECIPKKQVKQKVFLPQRRNEHGEILCKRCNEFKIVKFFYRNKLNKYNNFLSRICKECTITSKKKEKGKRYKASDKSKALFIEKFSKEAFNAI